MAVTWQNDTDDRKGLAWHDEEEKRQRQEEASMRLEGLNWDPVGDEKRLDESPL
jgi:hypothetical protein